MQVTRALRKIQTAQNAAFRTATGAHKMANIDHLHQESLMLRVKDHSDMLFAQFLVNCLEEDQSLSQFKTKTHEGDSPLQTSLNCSS